MKNNEIRILAGETEPYIDVLLSNEEALKAFNNRFNPFEIVRLGENDSESVIENEVEMCDALSTPSQMALSIGYIPQDFLMNLQEITSIALDKLQQSLPEGDRGNASRLIQKWAVEFTYHFYTAEMLYYDAIDEFVNDKFEKLKNDGYDVPERTNVISEIPNPKFHTGDDVWFMFDNGPVKGHINTVEIEVGVNDKSSIRYRMAISGAAFDENQVFVSCDELLDSLRK